MPKRVLQDEIGPWPKVYMLGPNSYEVVARHRNPRSINYMVQISAIPGFLLFFYIIRMTDRYNYWWTLTGSIAAGCGIFMLLRSILTDMPPLIHTTTRVRFENGWIKWGKHTIPPDMARQFRSDTHRDAPAEIRKMQRKGGMPVLQFSTEVFIDTGEGWMHNRRVAEIAQDEGGEAAHILSSTLRLVDNRARAKADTAIRQKARVDLD